MNHLWYLDWALLKLGVARQKDLLSISVEDFQGPLCGTTFLLKYYNDSPLSAITKNYPQFLWKPWTFDRVHRVCSLMMSISTYK